MTLSRAARHSLAVVAAAALLAAACSSGSDEPATGSTDTTAADTVVADPAAAAPVPSAGCGTSTTAAVTEERREVAIASPDGDGNRWYLVTTPTEHDGTTPVPLVLDFHGLSEGANIHALHSEMSAFASNNGFAVAYPNGTGNPVRWNALPTSDAQNMDGNDDLAYVDAVIDQLEADLCIDTSRIFATGLSNGAGMSSLLACVRADRIAAAAPVAGLRPPLECDASTTTPVLAIHGTVDPILYYNGGIGDLGSLLGGGGTPEAPPAVIDGDGYPAAARAWAAHNGCAPEPTITEIGSDIQRWVFDCPRDAEVEFFVVIGGGHTWPGSAFSKQIASIAGPTSDTISANQVMWDFFTRHSLATS